ncbi:MAG: histidine kinase [Bacteroidetes bacterium]|nr:histidine kinase [Bacteroidota bacterium]
MNRSYFLVTFLLIGAYSLLPAQNPYIHHYSTEDGLASNTVYFIFHDSRKFIWFATDAGISKYDGTTFTNYRKKDGLASNEVIRIKEDTFGRIWFFHFNGSLSYIFRNKIYSETNTFFLKSLECKEFYFDFLEDNDSTIYFYNRFCEITALDKRNKVTRYYLHEKLLRTIAHLFEKEPLIYLRRITKSAAGEFLIWTGNALFNLKTFSGLPRLNAQELHAYHVFQMKNDTIIVDSYANKLYKFSNERVFDSLTLPFYTKNFLKSIMVDDGGLFWVADYFKGVYCMAGDKVLHRFYIQKAQTMLSDHENNIWIGTATNGVFKINPYMLTHLHYPDSIFGHNGVIGMSPDGSGGVWLTSGNQVKLLKNRVFYEVNSGNRNTWLNCIQQMHNGSLIVGERGTDFYTLENARIDHERKTITFSVSEKVIYGSKNIAVNRVGKEIAAFEMLALYISDQDKMFRRETPIGLGERIYSIFYDLNGNLILNTRKMLQYREGKFLPSGTLSRFDNKIISNHLVIGNQAELFNVEGDSIYLFDKTRFYNLSDLFGAPIDLQIKNMTYHEPALYLSTPRNVYICDHPLDVISKKKIRIQLLDITFRNIHDILVNNDSLYIASDDGLTIIPEALIREKMTKVPIPYIRSVFINDLDKDPGEPQARVRGNTKVAFFFGCINYSSTPVTYAYKLEGLDTAWTMGSNGNVVYQRLSGGLYNFKLKVRKSTSEWSDVIEYPIEIKASFWQHPMFFTSLAIILLAMTALVIIRRKNNQIKHRELDHHLVTLELKSLQSMMNPHFIFNALGSIQNFLLQNKTGEAGLYLSQFARLIRQNMNAINAAMINLEDEVDRLKNYLDLERLRMENKFEYSVEIDENIEAEDMQIPSMIIQPFVENSIWHGISALDSQGFISIRFSLENEKSLKVIVEDNGIGIRRAQEFRTNGEKHLKLGMDMTRKRLELLGRKFSVKTRIDFSEPFPGNTNPGNRVILVMPVSFTGFQV